VKTAKTPHRPLADIAQDIHAALKDRTANNLRIGGLLVEAQSQLGGRFWGLWLNENFELTDRTAQRWMAFHRLVERLGISDTVSDLRIHAGVWYAIATDDSLSLKEIEVILDTAKTERIDMARLRSLVAAVRELPEAAAQKHEAAAREREEIESILDGPPPVLPQAKAAPPPPRDAASQATLKEGVDLLMSLRTIPVERLAGADVDPADLEFLASFLVQISECRKRGQAS
jgi:hypothetical protein